MQHANDSPYMDNEKMYDDIDILLSQLKMIEFSLVIIARILGQVQAQAIGGKIPSQPLMWHHMDNGVDQGK